MQEATGPVLAIGECMVEFFDRGDGCWQRGFAGDTLNVAWALRALLPADVPVGYVTRVGQDAVSEAMVDFIAAAGIGTASISRDPDRTVGLYTIATDAAGERSFSYWRQASAARHLADDAEALAEGLTGARLVYLSGITAAILGPAGRATLLTALKQAKAQGARIVHDPNHRPRLWQSRAAAQAFARLMGQDPAAAVRTAQAVAARVVMLRGALVPPDALRQAAGLPVRAGQAPVPPVRPP